MSPSAPPEAYTPKHLAQRILIERAALEGARKRVTILFADLKGSTELLADRDPEEARELLDPVLGLMMDAVHRYEGTVNQVMGDGIMALFGAPVAHEDHAVRACYASLRMQETVERYATDIWRRSGVPIQIRVGLNSGDVVVRSIGSDLHMDYTAVGQTTHVAARMEQSARPGTIFLTSETVRLAESYVRVQPLGRMMLKGLAEPVDVFELIGADVVRWRLHAAEARGLTEFVGRDVELRALHDALDQARVSRGGAVAVVGEPGIGKARLVWEFIRSSRTEDCLVLDAHAVSYDKATPYLPLTDMLRRYFDLGPDDAPLVIRDKITRHIAQLGEAVEWIVPAILALLDAPTHDTDWEHLDAPARRRRTLEAVRRLLFRESERQPVVLVVEDLHWIDSESEAVLDALIHGLPSARMLLVLTYRPEYRHDWESRRACVTLRLDSLLSVTADVLLGSLLGTDPALDPVKALLSERTAGNPFFLEESIRAFVETNVLVGARGAYRLGNPVAAIQVPATVQSVLAARIDRLRSDEKGLLEAASVVGRDVPFPVLEAISDMGEAVLAETLSNLQAADFLYESRLFPEVTYSFRHALTQEVAYGSLVRERRHALHQQLVRIMDRLYADRVADHAERLAHHALAGELWSLAVRYLPVAARKATARSASHEARVHLEQAVDALRRLSATEEVREDAIDVRLEIQEALQPLGDLSEMLRYLREAQTVAEGLGDQVRLGRVMAHMAYCLWWAGDPEGAIASGRRAIAIASTEKEVSLEVVATFRLGMAYFFSGALYDAMALFRRNIEVLHGERTGERFGLPHLPAVFSRVYHAWALTCTGDLSRACQHADDAVRLAEAFGHAFTTVWAYVAVGLTHHAGGDSRAAIDALERSMALWKKSDAWAFMFPWVAEPLGRAYATSGRLEEGVDLLEQSVDRSAAMNVIPLLTRDLTTLSEAYLLAGRFADARRSNDRALRLCRLHGQRLVEPEALRIAGEVSARQGAPDVDHALAHQRQALNLAANLGMRPVVAHCHFGLGKIYRRSRNHQQHWNTLRSPRRCTGRWA
jgi:class 3 adenylate cyclase/tetratricopeptide (TPR) repeat protein